MPGDDLVAQAFIELSVPRELAPDANPDLGNALCAAILMDPFHQGSPDATPLECRIDSHAPNVEVVRASLETQARDRPPLQPGQDAVIPSQVLSHIAFGLAESAAGRIQPGVAAERQARQAVELSRRLSATPINL